MITDADQAVKQVLSMIIDGKVTSVDGTDVLVEADTICVHGDGPNALEFAKQLRTQLSREGILIKRVGD